MPKMNDPITVIRRLAIALTLAVAAATASVSAIARRRITVIGSFIFGMGQVRSLVDFRRFAVPGPFRDRLVTRHPASTVPGPATAAATARRGWRYLG